MEQSKIKTALNNPLQKFFQEHGKKKYFLEKFGLGMGSEKETKKSQAKQKQQRQQQQ